MGKRNRNAVWIIAGELKGRRLRYPDEKIVRPTMQRTREALFDSIGRRIEGSVFVDLFAGAGGIGIEAMSRGASLVHFVEESPPAVELLRDNLNACGVPTARYRVHGVDVLRFLEDGALAAPEVRIVFADPPYGGDFAETIVAHFEKNAYDHIELLIIEQRGPVDVKKFRRLRLVKTRRFGDTFLTFFEPGG